MLLFFYVQGDYDTSKIVYDSNMNRKYKSDKIINNILESHFEGFRKLKWNRVIKEMSQHIIDTVE